MVDDGRLCSCYTVGAEYGVTLRTLFPPAVIFGRLWAFIVAFILAYCPHSSDIPQLFTLINKRPLVNIYRPGCVIIYPGEGPGAGRDDDRILSIES